MLSTTMDSAVLEAEMALEECWIGVLDVEG